MGRGGRNQLTVRVTETSTIDRGDRRVSVESWQACGPGREKAEEGDDGQPASQLLRAGARGGGAKLLTRGL